MTKSAASAVTLAAALNAVVVAVITVCASSCAAPERQDWPNTYAGDGPDAFLTDDDFACLDDARFANVEGRRIWNVFGEPLHGQAVALAKSRTPGTYPVGTVVQLFPGEAMVKRGAGFSAATGDWEYLVLDPSSGASVITARGTTDVGNVGGTCLSCHGVAQAFDSVCFTNTSCIELPGFIDTNVVPARDDARCQK